MITASYIPLSHSSDRYKVWEFGVNGGRIGFCFYAASNWAAHETSKKGEMVRSFGSSSNGVQTLFEQVAALGPSAMSCPPRIWNGLYYLYQEKLRECGDPRSAKLEIAKLFGPRMRSMATGGAPTNTTVKAFAKSFSRIITDFTFTESYGATECGAIARDTVVPAKSKRVAVALLPINGDKGFQKEDFTDAGVVGEAAVYSPNMSDGYLADPQRTSKAFGRWGQLAADELAKYRGVTATSRDFRTWYRTGDIVLRDNFGKVHVKGRRKERVRVDGGVLFLGALSEVFQISPLVRPSGVFLTVRGGKLLAGGFVVSEML